MSKTYPRGELFAFPGWRREGDRLVFSFDCSRYGPFEEWVDLPEGTGPLSPATGRLVTLLHVALGVSTYKAAAARRVAFPPMGPAGRAMAERLYTEGLAEFFVRAGLPYPPGTVFEHQDAPPMTSHDAASARGPALVAFGGGKDSYVARAIAQEAGDEVELAAVVMSDAVEAAIRATAPAHVAIVRRGLDPRLLSLKGAFNGHVPITAINALVLALHGKLTGAARVVFANERSADEPTMEAGGIVANHQDSKSSGFERLLAAAVAEADPGAPIPFSALRAYAEGWIARAFAGLKNTDAGPLPRFTSCNRNFRLAGDARARWCGACAKCAFTSLMLSPYLDEAEHVRAFGGRFLDEPALQPFFEALIGLTDTKPWDCVGTIAEARATLWRLSQGGPWADSEAVRALLPRVLAVEDEASLADAWDEALRPHEAPLVPDAYREAAARLSS